MTRIIGGRVGGRRLETPRGDATRPTSDRVREALLAAVESWCGSLEGLRVLDLYAGTGALGLEAWSRGAAAVTFVESHRRTAALIATNARSLGFGAADVRTSSVRSVLSAPPAAGYDLVLADPPYPLSEAELARDLAGLTAWLGPDALVVLERSSRSPEPTWPAGIVVDRSRRYGETTLWYGHAARTSDQPDPSDPSDQPDQGA